MAQRVRRRNHEEEHENEERWLLTYADMITLLMVLFIVLFSIGQLDLKKFEKLRVGLSNSFGTPTTPLQGTPGVLDGGAKPTGEGTEASTESITAEQALRQVKGQQSAAKAEAQALGQVKQQIQVALAGQGLGDQVVYRTES